MKSFDVIVIGGGIAGASIAASLAQHCRVTILEAEDVPGRHATGRSAAMYFETYGNAVVRGLARASRDFLLFPPDDKAHGSLMRPRNALQIARSDQIDKLEAMIGDPLLADVLLPLDRTEILRAVPILRPEYVAAGVLDRSGFEIDVDGLLQLFLRQARAAGAQFAMNVGFDPEITRSAGRWRVSTCVGEFEAPVIVNAAGAWADRVAIMAGVEPVGLTPLRRTALLTPPPEVPGFADWPLVIDVDETFYFKPEAGALLISPADEEPSMPLDAAPDEMGIALAVERFEAAATHPVRRITHRWAGLRTFAADRIPVLGFAPGEPGFFWLAGQGGFGIETAPAMGRLAASLVLNRQIPTDIAEQGVVPADLAPGRHGLGANALVGANSHKLEVSIAT